MSTPTPAAMPIPFGVSETGEFGKRMERAALRILSQMSPGASLSASDIATKADAKKPDFGMSGGNLIVGGKLAVESLSQAGWGVLYGPSVSDAIKQELQPLLKHRSEEVNDPVKIFDGPTGYQKGQSAKDWLAAASNNKASIRQQVDPDNGVPFYLLIVASPEEISFEFQYELDFYWGVGRLWFTPPGEASGYTRSVPEQFGCYARSVIQYEKAPTVSTSQEMALFAPVHQFDTASPKLFADVFDPFIQSNFGHQYGFGLRKPATGPAATKDALNNIFSGQGGTPALLFTGSHGLLRNADSMFLEDTMGAIVCQEWPGGEQIPPTKDQYYASRDLPDTANVHGMIHFLFACYGGGWPTYDTYQTYQSQDAAPVQISPGPMVARLPQNLLGRENGALAVLAHIDKAWSYSYSSNGQPQNQAFRDVLKQLMNGYRLGNATDAFNSRWGEISAELTQGMDSWTNGSGSTPEEVAHLWVARDDARNYIVFGDPAVHLRVRNDPAPAPAAPTAT